MNIVSMSFIFNSHLSVGIWKLISGQLAQRQQKRRAKEKLKREMKREKAFKV